MYTSARSSSRSSLGTRPSSARRAHGEDEEEESEGREDSARGEVGGEQNEDVAAAVGAALVEHLPPGHLREVLASRPPHQRRVQPRFVGLGRGAALLL